MVFGKPVRANLNEHFSNRQPFGAGKFQKESFKFSVRFDFYNLNPPFAGRIGIENGATTVFELVGNA